jgi:hypothetical protein
MGTFAETANVHYCLSFADQGKQTSIFRLQKTNGSLTFPFSVGSKQTKFFPNPFFICSSCKPEFVACLFVDKNKQKLSVCKQF